MNKKIWFYLKNYTILIWLSIIEKRFRIPGLIRYNGPSYYQNKKIYMPMWTGGSIYHEWRHFTQDLDGKLPITINDAPDYIQDKENLYHLQNDKYFGIYNEEYLKKLKDYLEKYPFEKDAYLYQFQKEKHLLKYSEPTILSIVISKAFEK